MKIFVEKYPLLSHRLEGEGVFAHLLEHGYEAVAAGRGEVLAQTDTVDEVEVGIEYVGRSLVRKHAQ